MKYLAVTILALGLMACGGPKAAIDKGAIEADIRRILAEQDAAWNSGDIEEFMQPYWNSANLRFASGGTIERGWQPTLERYLSRYPDRAAMGVLSFTELEIEVIDADDALSLIHI